MNMVCEMQKRQKPLRRAGDQEGVGPIAIIAGAAVAAIALVIGLSATGNMNTSWISSLLGMTSAQTILSQTESVADAYAAVIRTGQSATSVSFNGVPSTSDVLPASSGVKCLSSAGSIGTTASDCSALRATTVSGYSSQVFHSQGGGGSPPLPSGNSTNSAQHYIYTSLVAHDGTAIDAGTSAADIIMVLKDVKEGHCLQFNAKMWGDSETDITAIPASGLATLNAVVAGATLVTNTGAGVRTKGCVSTADGKYLVFSILAAL